jgi:hypothetical protein
MKRGKQANKTLRCVFFSIPKVFNCFSERIFSTPHCSQTLGLFSTVVHVLGVLISLAEKARLASLSRAAAQSTCEDAAAHSHCNLPFKNQNSFSATLQCTHCSIDSWLYSPGGSQLAVPALHCCDESAWNTRFVTYSITPVNLFTVRVLHDRALGISFSACS